MGTVYVKASRRAKGYTRTTSNRHRLLSKVAKKGSYEERRIRNSGRLLSLVNKAKSKKRKTSLFKRFDVIIKH